MVLVVVVVICLYLIKVVLWFDHVLLCCLVGLYIYKVLSIGFVVVDFW